MYYQRNAQLIKINGSTKDTRLFNLYNNCYSKGFKLWEQQLKILQIKRVSHVEL